MSKVKLSLDDIVAFGKVFEEEQGQKITSNADFEAFYKSLQEEFGDLPDKKPHSYARIHQIIRDVQKTKPETRLAEKMKQVVVLLKKGLLRRQNDDGVEETKGDEPDGNVEETKGDEPDGGQTAARTRPMSTPRVRIPKRGRDETVDVPPEEPEQKKQTTDATSVASSAAAEEPEQKKQTTDATSVASAKPKRKRDEPAVTQEASKRRAGVTGDSVRREAPPAAAVPVNQVPNNPGMAAAEQAMNEEIPIPRQEEPDVEIAAGDPDEDEQEDAVGQTTTESTRQNELAANELATLDYKPNFTEVMDPSMMRLATDASRGNLGAGTAAQMQSADVWGNMFSRPPPDLPGPPETFIKTDSNGMSVEEAESTETQKDVYSFLPFAKLGGVTVWIPRHVQTAKFFFTAEDYEELVSHVRDGDPLTLDKTDEVDSTVMMSTIIKSYGTLKRFCQLGPLLPMTASIEQVYAEWLEMRQIGRAVARYQQLTGGMYENTELSMKGGIRSAVASALRPFVKAWNQMHPNPQDQISEGGEPARPSSAPMFSGKRKAEAGVVAPEEYNPQFSFQPVELKRVKFSIPSI